MIRFSTPLIIIYFLIILNACKQAEKEEDTSVERIKVEVQKKYPSGNFDDYFSESKLVALESTESSFFSEINRLVFFDNKIISIYPAPEFKSQMKIYKKAPKIWKELPDYLKKMYNEVSDNGNPLLIIYTFKE